MSCAEDPGDTGDVNCVWDPGPGRVDPRFRGAPAQPLGRAAGVLFSAWPDLTCCDREEETGPLEGSSPCAGPRGHSPQGPKGAGGLEGPQRRQDEPAPRFSKHTPAKARPRRCLPTPHLTT